MIASALLVDTNILLRMSDFDTHHDEVLLTVMRERRKGSTLCTTLQNLAEFWNVATRPEKYNGFGLSIVEVAREIDSISNRFQILPETEGTFSRWRELVEQYNITGTLVHDTRLAAIMLEYSIPDILTLNTKDFARFPFLNAIDPREPI